jgi:hypothetical protein
LQLQDTSFLLDDEYAKLMALWVAEAEPISRSALRDYCDDAQPKEAHVKDLAVHYDGLNDYQTVAKMLPPMLPDIKVSKHNHLAGVNVQTVCAPQLVTTSYCHSPLSSC